MKIAVIVFNFFRNDSRVEKAIAAYREAGHEVRAVVIDDGGARPADVLAVELQPRVVFRRRPRPGPSLHRLLWKVESGALLAVRAAEVLAASVALWWRRGRHAPRGRLISLLRFADRIRGYREFAQRAAHALERAGFRPDLVHANDFNTLFAAELLHTRHGTPFIYDSHELWVERNRGTWQVHPIEHGWELDTERRIAGKALRVVTVSPSIARHLAGTLAVPEPLLVRNVPYARASAAGTRGLRAKLGIPAGAKLVVYTGKATYNRGLEEAVEALAQLGENFHLVVIGSYEPTFKARFLDPKIAAHGLGARFHQYGPVPSEEVPLWASEGDLSLVPIKGAACLSYEYCLPNKLFEGIQAGLPVLASNLVDMKGTLDQYRCGLTYESGDVQDLRDKIRHILTASGVAESLRRNAAAAARELNWESEKQRLVALL
jgi:glycosyltransferase involved in cell wall biosynthesis